MNVTKFFAMRGTRTERSNDSTAWELCAVTYGAKAASERHTGAVLMCNYKSSGDT